MIKSMNRYILDTVQDLLIKLGIKPRTLVYRIDVQDEINVQVGKFFKTLNQQDRIDLQ